MDLIGTDTRNRWSYVSLSFYSDLTSLPPFQRMYDDINTKFSRPNSATIRGPPYAHPKDQRTGSPPS
jgi:hypothetical protein